MNKFRFFNSLLTFVLISSIANAQIDKMTFEQSQDLSFYKDIKGGTLLKSYVAKNGAVISVGDTLKIGSPTAKITTTEFETNQRERNEFSEIQFGKPAGLGSLLNAVNGADADRPGNDLMDEMVSVREMYVLHKGSKKKPLRVVVILGEIHGRAFGLYKNLSTGDVEKAIAIGELKALNAPMTRDEAIQKLQEAKELFDLQVITKEEYEAVRQKCIPILKNN